VDASRSRWQSVRGVAGPRFGRDARGAASPARLVSLQSFRDHFAAEALFALI
jgi:hypothetical protein